MTPTPTSGAADLPEALIYAELPKHSATGLGEEYESFDQNGKPMGKAYQNLVYYTEDQMRVFADSTHAQPAASHGQAPAGATLPDGWVPLTITHEGQYPEEVAYGPQIMMDRLGKWLGKYFAQAAQAADSVTAVEREQERIAFKDAHRHLELYEVPDAWGRPMFKHSHVEASWLGWIARASRGQAPAGAGLPDGWVPLTITHEGQYPEEVAYGPQIMMDRLGKWLGKYFAQAAQAADSVTAPAPPPECETEAEKRAFAFGWFKALESERMKAESVQEDAARLDWLDRQCEGYGFQDIHEGNRWEVRGAYANLRQAIDAERAARKQGGA